MGRGTAACGQDVRNVLKQNEMFVKFYVGRIYLETL